MNLDNFSNDGVALHRRLLLFVVALLLSCALGIAIDYQVLSRYRIAPEKGIRLRTYALNVVNSSIPAWKFGIDLLQQMEEAHPGLTTEFGGPTDGDAAKQIEDLERLISKNIDGLIVCPADSQSLAPTIKKAEALGIPTIALFSDIKDSERLTFVSADEKNSASKLASQLIESQGWASAPDQSISAIAIITRPGLEFADQRLEGIRDACLKYKAIKLVRIASNEWSDVKGAEEVSSALEAFPDLKVVFGLDSRAAIGAITAARERGLGPSELLITGWDTDADVLSGISEGWVHSTSAPNMTYMMQLAVSALEASQGDYLYPKSLNLRRYKVSPIPSRLDVEQTLISKSNVAAFLQGRL